MYIGVAYESMRLAGVCTLVWLASVCIVVWLAGVCIVVWLMKACKACDCSGSGGMLFQENLDTCICS